jgi:hypothetical protein
MAARFPTIGRTIFCPRYAGPEDTPLAVITDMRFVHEYTCLQNALKRGDVLCVIRLQRGGHTTTVADHASETEYLNIPSNFIITNERDPGGPVCQGCRSLHSPRHSEPAQN